MNDVHEVLRVILKRVKLVGFCAASAGLVRLSSLFIQTWRHSDVLHRETHS